MNYSVKYNKYDSKYLKLQNQIAGTSSQNCIYNEATDSSLISYKTR